MPQSRTPAPWLATLLPACVLALAAAPAAAQTAPLNDTGQTQCFDGSNMVACSAANTGDAATHPRQDGRFGRDAQATAGMLTKVGGGAAGFDFTRICWNGAAEGTTTGASTCTGALVANTSGTATASPTTDWACTRDNVTGLVWSLQSQTATWNDASAATYPDAGHNSVERCGHADWRLPTRRELLSIVHYGQPSGPAIDLGYFPDTASHWYWSSESYSPSTAVAWVVYFAVGLTVAVDRGYSYQIRLVRGGQ